MKKLTLFAILLASIAGARGDSIKGATICSGAATLYNGSVVCIGQPFVGVMAASDGTVFNSGAIPMFNPGPPDSTNRPPGLTWPQPADIVYGTPLSGTQLNATANVPGKFDYSPTNGTVLNAGNKQPLRVKFTPTDSVKYAIATNTVFLNVVPTNSSKSDFNGDSLPDILFEDATGLLGYWSMDHAHLGAGGVFEPNSVRDAQWNLVGSGDFNKDGIPDLVFQHTNGSLALWEMDGTKLQSSLFFNPASSGPDWHLVGVGDVDGDDKADLLFQHTGGELAVWLMDGIKLRTASYLNPSHPGNADWKVAGMGDFNGDGKLDLVFQHDDGTLAVWLMNGTTLLAPHLVSPAQPGDSNWRVAAVVDLDGDGGPDLVFQHRLDSSTAVWFMDGYNLRKGSLLNPAKPGATWEIVGPR